MECLEVAQTGKPLAELRRFVAAELQVDARYRVLRAPDARRIRIDEDSEDGRERRKAFGDLRRGLDRNAPLAGRKDKADCVRAGF